MSNIIPLPRLAEPNREIERPLPSPKAALSTTTKFIRLITARSELVGAGTAHRLLFASPPLLSRSPQKPARSQHTVISASEIAVMEISQPSLVNWRGLGPHRRRAVRSNWFA